MYKLQQTGNQVVAIWAPANEQIPLKEKAKAMARQAVQPPTELIHQPPSAKATVLRLAKQNHQWKPIQRVGEYTKKFDTALPGKHTRLLYNSFNAQKRHTSTVTYRDVTTQWIPISYQRR